MWEGRGVYGFGLAVANVIPFAKLLVFLLSPGQFTPILTACGIAKIKFICVCTLENKGQTKRM